MKRFLCILLLLVPVLLFGQGQISIPITTVVPFGQVSIPVAISGLPAGCTSFEIIIEADQELISLDGIDPEGSIIEGKMFFSNNQSVVRDWRTGQPSTQWKSPYSPGRMIVVAADAYPFQGELMFTILATGKAEANVVLSATYLLLGTDLKFGKKPQMIRLSQ